MKILWCSGGLGNQLFLFAFYTAFRKTHYDLFADISYFNATKKHNGFELQKIFKCTFEPQIPFPERIIFSTNIISKVIKNVLRITKIIPYYYERSINQSINQSDFELFSKSKRLSVYVGYWQNEKYFKHIESEIRQKFVFPEFTTQKNIELSEQIQSTNSVSIHVRRGDYTQISCEISTDYYEKAILFIKTKVENPQFFVFSDDVEYCKTIPLLKKSNSIFVDWNVEKESFRDMQLMSYCKHNIIPNSTFSWWAAWLNTNSQKIVIAPQNWIFINAEAIVPKDWVKL